jgi:hypothetical protein
MTVIGIRLMRLPSSEKFAGEVIFLQLARLPCRPCVLCIYIYFFSLLMATEKQLIIYLFSVVDQIPDTRSRDVCTILAYKRKTLGSTGGVFAG